ncbi:MAG TPA: type II toxin-antitoxin system VapC family toxin [Candidatus Saccharimonadales bacterium]|jgi:PIN domain nuclease of toxin-antitoxin system|nr:type II toxin-antitoxin system VapC family toxin [Candidatus Saccharimonadales bacterium]
MLIDTHILVWILESKLAKLGTLARDNINNQPIVVSVATLIEIAVKKRKGKLDAPDTLTILANLASNNIEVLDIQPGHVINLPSLETIKHADPFDLLLISQSVSESLPFLTSDSKILGAYIPNLRLIDGRR